MKFGPEEENCRSQDSTHLLVNDWGGKKCSDKRCSQQEGKGYNRGFKRGAGRSRMTHDCKYTIDDGEWKVKLGIVCDMAVKERGRLQKESRGGGELVTKEVMGVLGFNSTFTICVGKDGMDRKK